MSPETHSPLSERDALQKNSPCERLKQRPLRYLPVSLSIIFDIVSVGGLLDFLDPV